MEREEDMSDITKKKKKGRTWCLSAWKGKKDMEGMTIYIKIWVEDFFPQKIIP